MVQAVNAADRGSFMGVFVLTGGDKPQARSGPEEYRTMNNRPPGNRKGKVWHNEKQ
jgi:hypothetical protein